MAACHHARRTCPASSPSTPAPVYSAPATEATLASGLVATGSNPGHNTHDGAMAQLGARLHGMQKVASSSLAGSSPCRIGVYVNFWACKMSPKPGSGEVWGEY
jgi:hypothetical protein